eukprot:7416435-Pyramimonas_sp.AAC.3
MSAWRFMRSLFCVAPPSTLSAATSIPLASLRIASSTWLGKWTSQVRGKAIYLAAQTSQARGGGIYTSRLWKQIASSAARARCAFVQYWVMPTIHLRREECVTRASLSGGPA